MEPSLIPSNPGGDNPDSLTSSGQPGQGVEYEHSNNGGFRGNGGGGGQQPLRELLVLLPLPDREGNRIPVVAPTVPATNPFAFIEKATGLPQEAQTRTTVRWPAYQQSTAYLVTCRPPSQSGELDFEVS